jgi:hypothetical protein
MRQLVVEVGEVDSRFGTDVRKLVLVTVDVKNLNLTSLTTVSDKEISAIDMTGAAGVSFVGGDGVHGLTVSEDRDSKWSGFIVVEDCHDDTTGISCSHASDTCVVELGFGRRHCDWLGNGRREINETTLEKAKIATGGSRVVGIHKSRVAKVTEGRIHFWISGFNEQFCEWRFSDITVENQWWSWVAADVVQ